MTLTLAHNLSFSDLHTRDGLQKLDAAFLASLSDELRARVKAARQTLPTGKEQTALILELAPHLDDFVAALFCIQAEVVALSKTHEALAPLYQVKRLLVQRRAAKMMEAEQAQRLDGDSLLSILGTSEDELEFATQVSLWLADEKKFAANLEVAARYAAWALYSEKGRARHGEGILFQIPQRHGEGELVELEAHCDGYRHAPEKNLRERIGFNLTDVGVDLKGALDQTNYCIWCAHQGKDSCSKGLRDKASGAYQKNAHNVTLAGCPLEEKISEFQETKTKGLCIGAVAIITIDNPMAAATGHRICNDCMKSCIYQKQEPVDIPQAETRTLKDVLALPWGFEIYALLTRWNPLNFARPLPLPSSNRAVLVAGMGPAGYTLCHHLLNDGHHVLGIDGLKIEPLPQELLTQPIRDIAALEENLGNRIMAGFGGVAEYGITVRWNKNFLKLIRLLIERRASFALVGGVRLGSTLTLDQAYDMGFDHVALCMGAGKPTVIEMKNKLARGVRQASDFLMALQLTGAAKPDSLANLEIRLPVVVIGGGLTAIDTATEARAYYPVQVEKFLQRYEALGESVRQSWCEGEREVADTFIVHARALRAAKSAKERYALIESWGGSTMAYRRKLNEAPSYTLNHEEVALALEEGIRIIDEATPLEVELDDHGRAKALKVKTPTGERSIPAATILVAAGTQPNTVLAREDNSVEMDGKYFRALDASGNPVAPEKVSKPAGVHVLMHKRADGRCASFFGDLHPSFAGNVVKAMGSAKQGYPVVSAQLAQCPPLSANPAELLTQMKAKLSAHVVKVERLTHNIVELVVHAPLAAEQFKPGQFYRLQNFETLAAIKHGTRMAMEGLALTGAAVDKARGEVSLIALEMGGSSSLIAQLKPHEPVVLMGPTGTATELPEGKNVLLIGGGLGNAVLFSIGAALREKGSRVLYFAGYKKLADRYKVSEIEKAADKIIWCSDEAPGFAPSRAGDLSFVGNMLDALRAYGTGQLEAGVLPLSSIDHIICIGSDRLMGAISLAREGVLKPYLKDGHTAIGSINSPMQCMMKEICAQCLQRLVDKITGEEKIVFSCFNQDQPLEKVDFENLHDRLSQNGASEKLTAAWIKKCAE